MICREHAVIVKVLVVVGTWEALDDIAYWLYCLLCKVAPVCPESKGDTIDISESGVGALA